MNWNRTGMQLIYILYFLVIATMPLLSFLHTHSSYALSNWKFCKSGASKYNHIKISIRHTRSEFLLSVFMALYAEMPSLSQLTDVTGNTELFIITFFSLDFLNFSEKRGPNNGPPPWIRHWYFIRRVPLVLNITYNCSSLFSLMWYLFAGLAHKLSFCDTDHCIRHAMNLLFCVLICWWNNCFLYQYEH